jgi:hypothetical protein
MLYRVSGFQFQARQGVPEAERVLAVPALVQPGERVRDRRGFWSGVDFYQSPSAKKVFDEIVAFNGTNMCTLFDFGNRTSYVEP